MAKVIHAELSEKSLSDAAKEIRAYRQWVESKEAELRLRLAQRGAVVASINFARAFYDGARNVSVRVDDTGSVAVIYAEGEAVAFIEFGSGARDGYGHPQAGQFGVGPGTYPGKGHWNDPNGWWFGNGQHSYGNPPAMAMYQAVQVMAAELTDIARDVFSN